MIYKLIVSNENGDAVTILNDLSEYNLDYDQDRESIARNVKIGIDHLKQPEEIVNIG